MNNQTLQRRVMLASSPGAALGVRSQVEIARSRMVVWVQKPMASANLAVGVAHHRFLEDLLAESLSLMRLRPKVDVRLDYENLHLGLGHNGYDLSPARLVAAILSQAQLFGNVVRMTAYADWGQLARTANRDLQRELVRLGVDTRYVINRNGKNSADMRIADDVSNLLERNPEAADGADVVVLGTCDRDFVPLVRRINGKSRKLVLLGISDATSRMLVEAARQSSAAICYLDQILERRPAEVIPAPAPVSLPPEMEDLVFTTLKVWKYYQQQKHSLLFIDLMVDKGISTQEALERTVHAKICTLRQVKSLQRGNVLAMRDALQPNLDHPLVRAVEYLEAHLPPGLDRPAAAAWIQTDQTFRSLIIQARAGDTDAWLRLGGQAGFVPEI